MFANAWARHTAIRQIQPTRHPRALMQATLSPHTLSAATPSVLTTTAPTSHRPTPGDSWRSDFIGALTGGPNQLEPIAGVARAFRHWAIPRATSTHSVRRTLPRLFVPWRRNPKVRPTHRRATVRTPSLTTATGLASSISIPGTVGWQVLAKQRLRAAQMFDKNFGTGRLPLDLLRRTRTADRGRCCRVSTQ